MERESQDSRQVVLLEVPRWAPLAIVLLSSSLFALILSLFFLLVWLAYSAGAMVTAQDEIRRSVNKQSIKVDRIYTNDRVRRDREEKRNVCTEHPEDRAGPEE